MLVVSDDFGNDEVQEGLGELRIKSRLVGERPQPGDLPLLASRVGGRHTVRSLELPDSLGALEALGEQVDQGGVDVVDARP